MTAENEDRAMRYFRHAVVNHWNPYELDLAADIDTLTGLSRRAFTQVRALVAMFGAGEENVTEELTSLAAIIDGESDQRFVANHMYEEAKHAAFFDRYWSLAIEPAEIAREMDPTLPTADRWFSEPYESVFDRTARAMRRLLDADTPANRARAYCHYHLTVEGVLGQTGFHAIEATFGPRTDGPSLSGLVEGTTAVRRDEGRHVGYGMDRLADLLRNEDIDRSLIEATVADLADPVDAVVETMGWKHLPGPDSEDLSAFAGQQRRDRLQQLPDGNDPERTVGE
ncbi:ribonucleotide-diphosphate reductase subunit beta [Halomicroarcula sp. F13]|uniref:Ribonucleotide-diphosphate reductase subunit beta n=1 Tax=Haloarcula rubra TaxID=2487747 RepID=A0AAW4PX37_9EURY|nr:ribonucleotide-diphosphate reductase subunit beta [Halomicroarcula rubra]MBX0325870.1 ribonucleotide-diphosphate reductase subunit beta [Halomicroarcula rubra]